jgi:aldose 1-epimerase
VQLELPDPANRIVRIIDDELNLDSLREQPSRYGNPILFPWASRIGRGRYSFEGKEYQAREFQADGDAWHGLVRTRAWEVIDSSSSADNATVTCAISTDHDPSMLDSYPFPHRLELTFTLSAAGFEVAARVANTGTSSMPFGLGFHPYFKLPGDDRGERSNCLLDVRAANLWDWKALGAVKASDEPGPRTLKVQNTIEPRTRLGARQFNDGFTDLQLRDGWAEARVIDPAGSVAIQVRARPGFQTFVVYSPADRNALCLEPWTCTANMFQLAAAGYEHSGMILLQPGNEWVGEMKISLESIEG